MNKNAVEYSFEYDEQEDKQGSTYLKRSFLKKQILRVLYKEGPKTLADLREITNNSIPSLTNIMQELMEASWTKKVGIRESQGGRKPALYHLNPDKGYYISIRLSRKNTRIIVFNFLNEALSPTVLLKDGLENSENVLQLVKDAVYNLLKEYNLDRTMVLGYGITIPGLINIRKEISHSYTVFAGRKLSGIFEELFEKPVIVEHDTKAMALGELWFGLAKKRMDALFISVGSGIGLGQIINGELYRGHSGFSGEFGHIQMVQEGELCYCGKIGCLETVASGTALVKKAKEQILQGKSSTIQSMVGGNINNIKLNVIIEAAHNGDQFAIELLEDACEYLAKGISILIHLYNPESVIIGGDIADAKQLLIGPVRQKLNKYTMKLLRQETRLLFSDLKEKAGLMGVLPIIMEKILSMHFDENAIYKV
jgi:N-acetylglucosamine repressor